MKINPRIGNLIWKIAVILLPVTIMALITFGFAQAAFYSINTNDAGSVSSLVDEWNAHGIPVFLNDPTGDADEFDEDIVSTWVAIADEEGSDGIV